MCIRMLGVKSTWHPSTLGTHPHMDYTKNLTWIGAGFMARVPRRLLAVWPDRKCGNLMGA